MPESNCLHIQDSASGPIRVVEVSWPLVRIGRATFCEIRLCDAGMAAEICRLQRRAGKWQIEPLVPNAIEIEGRSINGIRLLPYDTPIQIGNYCLTLRANKSAAPNWSSYGGNSPVPASDKIASEKVSASPANWGDSARPLPPERPEMELGKSRPVELPRRPTIVAENHEARIGHGSNAGSKNSLLGEQKRWENRWRAAGEKLRATPSASPKIARPESRPRTQIVAPAAITPGRASSHEIPSAAPLTSVPLKEPLLPRSPIARSASTEKPTPSDLKRPANRGLIPASESEPIVEAEAKSVADAPAPVETIVPTPDPVIANIAKEPVATILPTSQPLTELEAPAELTLPQEPSLDDRISAWEPSLFAADPEPTAAPVPVADEEASDVESSSDGGWLNAGTHWVAPADCLESVTASFETGTFSDVPIGFIASTEDAPEVPLAKPQTPSVTLESVGPRRAVSRQTVPELVPPAPPINAGRSTLPQQAEVPPRSSVVDPWPSVEDILAAHGRGRRKESDATAQASKRAAEERRRTRAMPLATPSLAREPECWELPLWLGWPPLAFVSLLIVVLSCAMSWSWSWEARGAAIVAHRLLGKEATELRGRPIPLPEGIAPPAPVWWRASARHLTNWAAYLARSPEGRERPEEIRELLEAAVKASPIYAPARLALARLDDLGNDPARPPSAQSLALSRDPITLSWSARRHLKAGRKELALAHFRRALELASHPEITHDLIPRFEDDPQEQRYLLPGEDLVSEILDGLVTDPNLEFPEWASILPRATVAPLVASRLLRERSRLDSEASLDMLLKDGEASAEAEDDREQAIQLAVKAEAFAARGKLKEAEQCYLEAIERVDHHTISRSWWFNLANIENRLKDEAQRQKAIKNAVASMSTPDEIARRASDLNGLQERPTESASRIRGAASPRAN